MIHWIFHTTIVFLQDWKCFELWMVFLVLSGNTLRLWLWLAVVHLELNTRIISKSPISCRFTSASVFSLPLLLLSSLKENPSRKCCNIYSLNRVVRLECSSALSWWFKFIMSLLLKNCSEKLTCIRTWHLWRGICFKIRLTRVLFQQRNPSSHWSYWRECLSWGEFESLFRYI